MTELEAVREYQNSPRGRVEAEVAALRCAASNLWKMRMANDTADHVIDSVGEYGELSALSRPPWRTSRPRSKTGTTTRR